MNVLGNEKTGNSGILPEAENVTVFWTTYHEGCNNMERNDRLQSELIGAIEETTMIKIESQSEPTGANLNQDQYRELIRAHLDRM